MARFVKCMSTIELNHDILPRNELMGKPISVNKWPVGAFVLGSQLEFLLVESYLTHGNSRTQVVRTITSSYGGRLSRLESKIIICDDYIT